MKANKILVPLDGSELAEAAVADALDVANRHSASLMLVRATEAHILPGVDPIKARRSLEKVPRSNGRIH